MLPHAKCALLKDPPARIAVGSEQLNLDARQSKNVPIFALLVSEMQYQNIMFDEFRTSGDAAGVSKGGAAERSESKIPMIAGGNHTTSNAIYSEAPFG